MSTLVLLVDGAADRRAANRAVLERAGYSATEALTVARTLEIAERRPRVVVVVQPGSDAALPLGIASELRRRAATRHVPVLVFADDLDPEHADALEAMDALTCLRDPCPPATLLEEVQYATLHLPGRDPIRAHSPL
jgi:PleD family two-component response regulator